MSFLKEIPCQNCDKPTSNGVCFDCSALRHQQSYRDGAANECTRWVKALEEFGFHGHPGLSVKENLAAFGDWWAKRKAAGN